MELQQPAIPHRVLDRIERYVRSRTSGMIRDLHVEEREGRVVILGHTTTYYVKQLATHGAQAACEGLALENAVEVSA